MGKRTFKGENQHARHLRARLSICASWQDVALISSTRETNPMAQS
jgi:hypothetical protein